MKILRRMIRKAVNNMGYEVSRYDKDSQDIALSRFSRYLNRSTNDYLSLYKYAEKKTGSAPDFAKEMRFFILYQTVHEILRKQVPGSFVECGCFKGHSTLIIAHILESYKQIRPLYVFDSFEHGLSEKTPEDRTEYGNTTTIETLRQKESFFSSHQEVSNILKPYEFVEVYSGWIPKVFKQATNLAHEKYAFVHLDVDLYQPTRDSLAYFMPKMSKGGAIIIDDFGYTDFPGAKKAVLEVLAEYKVSLFIENHLGGCLIIV